MTNQLIFKTENQVSKVSKPLTATQKEFVDGMKEALYEVE
jgi:hypothetical protein